MTKYVAYKLPLSEAQQHRIRAGHPVRLKPSQLGGTAGVVVHLTATQVGRIGKAAAGGKGCQITLSKAQLDSHRHDLKGDGIFDSIGSLFGGGLVDDLVGAAKGAAGSLFNTYAPKGVEAGVKLGADQLHKLIGNDKVPEALRPFLNLGVDMGSKYGEQQLQHILKGIQIGKGLVPTGGGLYLP